MAHLLPVIIFNSMSKYTPMSKRVHVKRVLDSLSTGFFCWKMIGRRLQGILQLQGILRSYGLLRFIGILRFQDVL